LFLELVHYLPGVPLKRGESYDIIDELHGENRSMVDDDKQRNAVKQQRYRAKDHLKRSIGG
ncbi:MAG: hypothetical protein AAB037_02610, partial [Chloroflexota bacterium]